MASAPVCDDDDIYKTRRRRGDDHACITRKGHVMDRIHTYLQDLPRQLWRFSMSIQHLSKKPVYVCTSSSSSSSYPRPTQNHPHHLSESLTCLSLSKTTSISTYKAAPTPSLSLFSANLVKNAKALSALGERPWLHTRLRS